MTALLVVVGLGVLSTEGGRALLLALVWLAFVGWLIGAVVFAVLGL